jgi:hypothetical protein
MLGVPRTAATTLTPPVSRLRAFRLVVVAAALAIAALLDPSTHFPSVPQHKPPATVETVNATPAMVVHFSESLLSDVTSATGARYGT